MVRIKERGFTLLEILIALFIFAIMSVILAFALHNVFSAKERLSSHVHHDTNLQMALLLLARDMSQLIDLPVNSLYESNQITSSINGTPTTLNFITNSFANPGGIEKRSSLQRVEYHVENHALLRTNWSTLYPDKKDVGISRVLLSPIKSLHFTYISPHHLLYEAWPPVNFPDASPPIAIRMTIVFSEGNALTELYNIQGDSLAPTL